MKCNRSLSSRRDSSDEAKKCRSGSLTSSKGRKEQSKKAGTVQYAPARQPNGSPHLCAQESRGSTSESARPSKFRDLCPTALSSLVAHLRCRVAMWRPGPLPAQKRSAFRKSTPMVANHNSRYQKPSGTNRTTISSPDRDNADAGKWDTRASKIRLLIGLVRR